MVFLVQLALLLVYFVQAQDQEHSLRLVACMQVTRYRLTSQKAQFDSLADQSSFKREEVVMKWMGQMIVHCMDNIPLEACEEIIRERESDDAAQRYVDFAPMPTGPIVSEVDMMLSKQEEDIFSEIMEKTKKAEEMRARGEAPGQDYAPTNSQPIGTSLGVVYILIVFLIFAGFVIYGIKRMDNRGASKKDKKKKRN